jgi:hypothetical protein
VIREPSQAFDKITQFHHFLDNINQSGQTQAPFVAGRQASLPLFQPALLRKPA